MSSERDYLKLENLSELEKMSLFGEPTKKVKLLETFKQKMDEGRDKSRDTFISKNTFPLFSDSDQLYKKKKIFLQKFVIDVSNGYKSIWDLFLLFLIAYNCVLIAYK